MTDTERVTMVWPSSLKEQVRERVGQRGLTGFVLEAVQTKLGTHDAVTQEIKETSRELNEARDLAQRMADLFVRQGDYEDPTEQLQELALPAWIATTGWPSELAKLVPPEDSRLLVNVLADEPEKPEKPEAEVEPIDVDGLLHRPMALAKPKDPNAKPDLFARLQSQVPGLKPASEILAPGATEPVSTPVPNVVTPSPVVEAAVDVCPVCGSALLDGECWECF